MSQSKHRDKTPTELVPHKVPFQRFVEAKKAGIPVDMYPLPPGAKKRRTRPIDANQLRGMMLLAAVVAGVVIYFGDFSIFKGRGGTNVKLNAPSAETQSNLSEQGTTAAEEQKHPAVRASQYLDPSEQSHFPYTHRGILRNGDFLTIMPETEGVQYLYFIVLGTRDTFKLTRFYPPSLLVETPPPRKFAVKSSTAGLFQVMLLGTSEPWAEQLQVLLQKANSSVGVDASDDRHARSNQLLADLSTELPAESWTYCVLDPVPFQP